MSRIKANSEAAALLSRWVACLSLLASMVPQALAAPAFTVTEVPLPNLTDTYLARVTDKGNAYGSYTLSPVVYLNGYYPTYPGPYTSFAWIDGKLITEADRQIRGVDDLGHYVVSQSQTMPGGAEQNVFSLVNTRDGTATPLPGKVLKMDGQGRVVLDPDNKDGFGPDVTVVDSGQTVNLKDALTRLRSPSKEDDQPYDLLMLEAARYSGTWIKDRGQSFVLESGVLKRVSVEGLNDVNLIGMFNHTGQFAYVEAPKAGYGTFGHVMIQDASGTRDLGPVPGSEGTYLSTMDDAGNLIAAINLFGNFYGGTYYSSAQGYWYQFESFLPSVYAGYRDVDYGALSPDGHIVLTLMKDGSPSKVVVLTPAVPEPATLGLMSLGLLALSAAAIRRQRASGTTTSAPCSA